MNAKIKATADLGYEYGSPTTLMAYGATGDPTVLLVLGIITLVLKIVSNVTDK